MIDPFDKDAVKARLADPAQRQRVLSELGAWVINTCLLVSNFTFAATIADGFGMRRSTITDAVPRTIWPTFSGLDRGVLCLNKKCS